MIRKKGHPFPVRLRGEDLEKGGKQGAFAIGLDTTRTWSRCQVCVYVSLAGELFAVEGPPSFRLDAPAP